MGVAGLAGALSSIPGIGFVGAGLISGGLFMLESIWENRDILNTPEGFINVVTESQT